MSKHTTTETDTAIEETGNTKRDITVTIVSTTVTVVLSVAANIIVARIGKRVTEALTKKPTKTEDE